MSALHGVLPPLSMYNRLDSSSSQTTLDLNGWEGVSTLMFDLSSPSRNSEADMLPDIA